MKGYQDLFRRLHKSFARVHLVDKCLIGFMLLLLVQSSFSLFFDRLPTSESNPIDVIIRTSMAAIFGYFLSANFIRSQASSKGSLPHVPQQLTGQISGPQARIGFAPPEQEAACVSQNPSAPPEASPEASPVDEAGVSRLQILIATAMGLFCLLVLTIVRNSPPLAAAITASPSTHATIAQFRDIVSGCVGFLIGCPTTHTSPK